MFPFFPDVMIKDLSLFVIPPVWGQAGVEFISDGRQRIRSEIIPMAVLITNGVEEGSLGMVTTFCHHDHAKVESLAMLSTLCQQDSPKPSVVVVKINSPYLPWGSSSFLDLDITTLSLGALTTQLPLDQLCPAVAPNSPTQDILPCEAEDKELKVYPILQEILWESSEEDNCLSDPILLLVPPSPFFLHHEENSQTEEGPSLSLALTQLQGVSQARAQLKWELAHEWEGLVKRYEDWQSKLATKHEDQRAVMATKHEECWARMEEEMDATFWEVFSETSSIDSIRLLLWCISTPANPGALPACYLCEALATTVQWRVEIPMPATAPESGVPQAQVSMSRPAHQTKTPPHPILPLSNIPLIGTHPVGHSLTRLLVDPQHTKWDHSPNGASNNQPGKRAHTETAEAKVSSGHSTLQGDREPPETPPEACNNGVYASRSAEEHNSEDNTDHSSDESTQDESRENAADSDLEWASGDCLTCSDMEELAIRMAWKRFQKRLQASCSIVRAAPGLRPKEDK